MGQGVSTAKSARPDDTAMDARSQHAESAKPSNGRPTVRVGRAPGKRTVLTGAGIAVAALFAVAGYGVASSYRTVEVTVDGVSRPVGTFSSTVGGALADAGVRVGAEDSVSLPLDAALPSGLSSVEVRRSRSLGVVVNSAPAAGPASRGASSRDNGSDEPSAVGRHDPDASPSGAVDGSWAIHARPSGATGTTTIMVPTTADSYEALASAIATGAADRANRAAADNPTGGDAEPQSSDDNPMSGTAVGSSARSTPLLASTGAPGLPGQREDVRAVAAPGVPVVSSRKTVTVAADGRGIPVEAREGEDARQILARAGVAVGPLDRITIVSPVSGRLVNTGQWVEAQQGAPVVNVQRVTRGERETTRAIASGEEVEETGALFQGEWEWTPGADGLDTARVWAETIDGEDSHAVVLSASSDSPRAARKRVGTYPVSPLALIDAGIDPKAGLEEETDPATGVVSLRYRAELGSLSTAEEIDAIRDPAPAAPSGGGTNDGGGDDGQAPAPSGAPVVGGTKSDWLRAAGIPESDWAYADYIVSHESGWNPLAQNPSSGAYGLCQSLPGSKMASAGADWRTNPVTQLRWMKSYVDGRYGGFAGAYRFWTANHWY